MSKQSTLYPDWLRDARRRAAKVGGTLPSQGASHDRRLLLEAYDEQARRLTELESQLAEAQAYVPGKVTPAALLNQLLGHLDSEGLDFVYDKLTRRCPLGKKQSDALAAARQELAEQAGKHSELRGQVTAMLEDFANGCALVKMEPGVATTPYWMGVNKERHNNLLWAELKCKELGITWPIKPIPYQGDLPSEPAPAAALPTTGEGKLPAVSPVVVKGGQGA